MHLILTMNFHAGLELPINHNHILQAIIYKSISPDMATFLHDQGYQEANRRFKLFTFSRLSGKFSMNREKGTVTYSGPTTWIISSPVMDFCQSLATGVLLKQNLTFGERKIEISRINVEGYQVTDTKMIVETKSPVVAYRTDTLADHRKYTRYYEPGNADYDSLIDGNLRKKYRAMYHQDASEEPVAVRPIGPLKLNIMRFKDSIIKGYTGKLQISGPVELLQIALDAGLGSKNSQGFGCVQGERI